MCMYICMCVYVCACMSVCVFVHVCVCVGGVYCTCVRVCVYMCVCDACARLYRCVTTLKVCTLRRLLSASLQGCILGNEALTTALLAENMEPTESKAPQSKPCWAFHLHHQSIQVGRSVGCSWGVHRKSTFLPRSTSSCLLKTPGRKQTLALQRAKDCRYFELNRKNTAVCLSDHMASAEPGWLWG